MLAAALQLAWAGTSLLALRTDVSKTLPVAYTGISRWMTLDVHCSIHNVTPNKRYNSAKNWAAVWESKEPPLSAVVDDPGSTWTWTKYFISSVPRGQ